MKISLSGKTALVTGGSSGIGAACVRLFRESGAVVFLASSPADYITGQTLFVDGGILVNSYKE
jgi:NAD(P)-dependent dehydrogenase (short-subunit alcohol dehydrogenase family)